MPQIGPYTLLRTLGEGGMGTVYLAEQKTPVERRVALKVIKVGMDTRDVVSRFEAERQALAVMDHPGIAHVFDAGATDTGRPFFAMEFVEGEPITKFCDAARLSLRDRIALAIDVCRAVQHAHQKGIVHRDLKPSNVLVAMQDGKPAAKIIDFGIAKAIDKPLTDQTFATEIGRIVGTPAYMSPEQLGLTGQDIDTRADIYSLGVLLYELFAGTRPFEAKELETGYSLIDAIKNEEPSKPSARLTSVSGDRQQKIAASRQTDAAALRRTLERDLDWIVLKAIEKDRSRRYDTANTLAGDLQRYLNNEPVSARPPARAYRVRKFVGRHRVGVAAAATILMLIVGSAGVIAAQAARVASERDRATLEAAKAQSINEFLQEMLSAANPIGTGSRTLTVVEALDAAEKRLDSALGTQPEVAGAVRRTLGSTYLGLGEYDRAQRMLTAAADASRAEGRRQDLALDLAELGGVLHLSGKYADALRVKREALEVGRASGLAPERIAYLQFLEAGTLTQQNQHDEAERIANEALDVRRRTFGPESREVAASYRQLSVIAANKGDFARSDTLVQQSIDLARRLLGPAHTEVVGTMNDQATSHIVRGEFDKAQPIFEELAALQRKSLGDDHPETATAIENHANVLYRLKRYPEATARLEEVLAIRKRALGDDSMPVARTMYNMGVVYTNVGDFAKADPNLREGLDRLRRALGADHPEVAQVTRSLGVLRERQGQLPAAEALYREALARSLKALGPDHAQVATAHITIGRLLVIRKQYAEAETHLLKGRAIREKALGPTSPLTVQTIGDLVKLYDAWGKPDKAKALREGR